MRNLKVAILTPPEATAGTDDRRDTFVQAAEISECLTILGHKSLIAIFADDRAATADALSALAPDLVVNLVEDVPEGADHLHLATALLDRLGLSYTGAPTAALAALGDKRRVNASLRAAGLPAPPAFGTAPPQPRYIVKSATEHASIGIDASSVVAAAAVDATLADRQRHFGGLWFAEAYIDGREFNVGLLETREGPRVLPIAEIRFLDHADRPKLLGYAEKWAADSPGYAATPRVFPAAAADRALLAELARLARAVWDRFGLAGYARVDFRVDAAGHAYILDVNANPCLARDAGFCAAAHEAGLSQTDIVAHLIETALA